MQTQFAQSVFALGLNTPRVGTRSLRHLAGNTQIATLSLHIEFVRLAFARSSHTWLSHLACTPSFHT
eukprot:15171478-Alexandrium_andersonii.AAC.1